ncbi:MAG TPA: hypothetical protein PKN33_17360 [Phycisphaerae bacterium]|nr:hypothetical protein [Phycisphaerae bacterium]
MATIPYPLIVIALFNSSVSTVTVSFTGELTSASDSEGQLDPSIAVGTPFSGSFTFDPSLAVDSDPSELYGVYEFDSTMQVNIGNAHFESSNLTVRASLTGGITGGQGYGASGQQFVSEGILIDYMGISLWTYADDVLNDDSLFESLDLADFPVRQAFYLWADDINLYGQLNSIVIPEPSGFCVLLTGALLAASRRRSRKAMR